jgi:hypothetical protein
VDGHGTLLVPFKRREHDDGWSTQEAALRTSCLAVLQIQGYKNKVVLVHELSDVYEASTS